MYFKYLKKDMQFASLHMKFRVLAVRQKWIRFNTNINSFMTVINYKNYIFSVEIQSERAVG